jgi:N12 class adenine-specific DNA methylase
MPTPYTGPILPINQETEPVGLKPYSGEVLPLDIAPAPERTWGEAFSDTGKALAKGTVGLARTAYGGMDASGAANNWLRKATGVDVDAKLGEFGQAIGNSQSESIKARGQQIERAAKERGEVAGWTEYATDPGYLANQIVESAPMMLGIAYAARRGQAMGLARAKAKNLAPAEATALGEKYANYGAAIGGGVLEGSGAGAGARDRVNQMSEADLMAKNDMYGQLLAQGATPEDARYQVARAAGDYAFGVAAPISAVAGKLTGAAGLEAKVLRGKLSGDNLGAKILKEAGEEFIQEGGNQFAQNAGIQQYANRDQSLSEDVLFNAGVGAITGAVQGGGVQVADTGIKAIGKLTAKPYDGPIIPLDQTGQPPAGDAGQPQTPAEQDPNSLFAYQPTQPTPSAGGIVEPPASQRQLPDPVPEAAPDVAASAEQAAPEQAPVAEPMAAAPIQQAQPLPDTQPAIQAEPKPWQKPDAGPLTRAVGKGVESGQVADPTAPAVTPIEVRQRTWADVATAPPPEQQALGATPAASRDAEDLARFQPMVDAQTPLPQSDANGIAQRMTRLTGQTFAAVQNPNYPDWFAVAPVQSNAPAIEQTPAMTAIVPAIEQATFDAPAMSDAAPVDMGQIPAPAVAPVAALPAPDWWQTLTPKERNQRLKASGVKGNATTQWQKISPDNQAALNQQWGQPVTEQAALEADQIMQPEVLADQTDAVPMAPQELPQQAAALELPSGQQSDTAPVFRVENGKLTTNAPPATFTTGKGREKQGVIVPRGVLTPEQAKQLYAAPQKDGLFVSDANIQRIENEAAQAAPSAEGPGDQFNSYDRFIQQQDGEVSPGLAEQIRNDERLNDGEAEQLLANAQQAPVQADSPATDSQSPQQEDDTSDRYFEVEAVITGQLRKQKEKITRLQNVAKKDAALSEKLARQKAANDAESQLRQMRLKVFEATDAANAVLNGSNPAAFGPYSDLYPDAAKLLSSKQDKPAPAAPFESQAVADFLSGKRDDAPEVAEVEQERQAFAAKPEPEAKPQREKQPGDPDYTSQDASQFIDKLYERKRASGRVEDSRLNDKIATFEALYEDLKRQEDSQKEQDNEPLGRRLEATGLSSDRTLEGVSTSDVPAPEQSRDATQGSDAGSGENAGRDGGTDEPGVSERSRLGDREGNLPVPARRTRNNTGTGGKRRVSAGGTDATGTERSSAPEQQGLGFDDQTSTAAQQAQAQAVDFRITDDVGLGEGGQKTKFKRNVAAIRLLNELEQSGRQATPDEQNTLARYVGWGGLAQAFDEANQDWRKEFAELKEILTPEEYDTARQSTRYAHYTSKEVIEGMYDAMKRLGFASGKVLEPGSGVGNFLGLRPDAWGGAVRFTSVERERIAGGIAKQLYPNQNVQLADFREFNAPNNYFDAAIGNPPFDSTPLTDLSGRKHLSGLSVHNYFFAKSLDMLRPGGVLAMVVSNSLMDAQSDRARVYMGERAELLGAIRLPNNAFAKNANTEVTTDIIFLKKRPDGDVGSKEARDGLKGWRGLGQVPDPLGGKPIPINQYFVNHPEMIIGRMERSGSMYRADMSAAVAPEGMDIAKALADAVARLPEGVYEASSIASAKKMQEAAIERLESPVGQEGGFFTKNGKLYQRLADEAGEARAIQLTPATQWTEKTSLGIGKFNRLIKLATLRDTLRSLIAAEMADKNIKQIDALRAQLNEQYDAYTKENGLLNEAANVQLYGEDPDFPLLASLEMKFNKGISDAVAKRSGVKPVKPSAEKAAIFTKRVLQPRKEVTSAKSPQDAVAISLAERGRLDAAYIGDLLGRDGDEVLEELASGDKPALFFDPAEQSYVPSDEYLSGNVRKKMEFAKKNGLSANARALEKVIPEDVPAHEITGRLGSPWIPVEVYEDFIKHLLGDGTKARVRYQKLTSSFAVDIAPGDEIRNTNVFGTAEVGADKLINAIMNNGEIKVYDPPASRDERPRLNKERTDAANDKASEIKQQFGDWLMKDSDRAEVLGRAYNDTNNNYVKRVFDGSRFTFPGKVPDSIIKFRRHQRNAVARLVYAGRGLLDHVVGAGKTFTVIGAAMEMRRTGLAKKPLIAVPNHLVKQWAADFYRLYPGANILTATKKDFERANRRAFLAKIATGDWDAVIMAHSSYGFVKPDPQFEAAFNQRQIDLVVKAIESLSDDKDSKRTVKQLEKLKEGLDNRIKSLREKPVDDLLDFAQLGVDHLFVDEAHMFKNLMFATKMQNVRGLGQPKGSQRAYDMYIKTQQLFAQNGGQRGVTFATGTPVSNSLAEMYHMMRYLQPEVLQDMGHETFDAWANTFAEVEPVWMQAMSGDGYKASNRMSKFVNAPELIKIFDQVSDTVTMDDIKAAYSEENNGEAFPIPALKGGRRTPVSITQSKAQQSFMEDIASRAKAMAQRKGPPQKGEDNMLSIMSDARKAAMDIRLVDPDVTERDPNGRIAIAANNIMDRYKQFDSVKGTQLVFSDMGVPKKHLQATLKEYNELSALAAPLQDENLNAMATLGDESAMEKLEQAEAAQEKIDAKGQDWLDAIKAAQRGFSIYDDMREALIDKGIPAEEIAFIHDYNTDDQKAGLFRAVNDGRIRVLIGSTEKMGAGTNVQERAVALHHLDVPWKPSDIEQREGRVVRQGNLLAIAPTKEKPNPLYIPGFEVEVMAYATQDTLDLFMWQTQEKKLSMIMQLRSGEVGREIDNAFEELQMSAGEMQAAATSNPYLLEEIQLKDAVKKLERQQKAFQGQQNELISAKKRAEDQIARLPGQIAEEQAKRAIRSNYEAEIEQARTNFSIKINGKTYTEQDQAALDLRALSGDDAEEKGKRMAPVNINGATYTSKTAVADAWLAAVGDRAPIRLWVEGKLEITRKGAAENLQEAVENAYENEGDDPVAVAQIAGTDVMIQVIGTPNNSLYKWQLAVTLNNNRGEIAYREVGYESKDKLLQNGPRQVAEQAANMVNALGGDLESLNERLQKAKKNLADAGKVATGATFPKAAELEAARLRYKEVLKKLAVKDDDKQEGCDVVLSRMGQGDDIDWNNIEESLILEAPVSPLGDDFGKDQFVFLSSLSEGTKTYRPTSGTQRTAKAASIRARDELGLQPTLKRNVQRNLGNFRGFTTSGRITQSLSGQPELTISLYGQEQMEQNLVAHPALKITIGEDGEFSIYGPPSDSKTYAEFEKRGWAEPARGKDGEIHWIDDKLFWTRLTDVKNPGFAEVLGDIHARALEWLGKEHIGLHWVRTTGATGGPEGRRSAIFFSKKTDNSKGSKATMLNGALRNMAKGWANAPTFSVVQSVKDLPDNLQAKLKRQDALDDAEGFLDPKTGQVWLIADHLPNAQRAAEVLLHEVMGHYGLRGAFGQRLQPMLMSIYRDNDTVRKAADQMSERYGYSKVLAVEEVLSDMAADGRITEQPFWQKLMSAIRNGLRSIGFTLRMNDGDVQAIMAQARRYVTNGPRKPAGNVAANTELAYQRKGQAAPDQSSLDESNSIMGQLGKSPKASREWVRKVAQDKGERAAQAVLRNAFGRAQRAEMYRDSLPGMWQAHLTGQKMDGQARIYMDEADKLARRWAALPQPMMQKLAELMHGATLWQIHPDKGIPERADPDQRKAYAELSAIYQNGISQEARAVYQEALGLFNERAEQAHQALIGRIERMDIPDKAKAMSIKSLQKEFDQRMKGPYFPLSRFGEWQVRATRVNADGETERITQFYESPAQMREAAQMLSGRGWETTTRKADPADTTLGNDASPFVEAMMKQLDGLPEENRIAMLDDLNQLFVRMLPEASARKHFIHRKNIAGFSTDALRGFAKAQASIANQIARLNHQDIINRHLRDARKQAETDPVRMPELTSAVDAEVANQQWLATHKTSPVASALTSFGYVWGMAGSIAAGAVNLSQVALSMAHLGSKYKEGNAGVELGRSIKHIAESAWVRGADGKRHLDVKNSPSLSKEERDAMRELGEVLGKMDLTLSMELMALTSQDNLARGGMAGKFGAGSQVMRWLNAPMHYAERINRMSTGLAAYRMGRKNGLSHEAAIAEAAHDIDITQFDYSLASRAGAFQGDAAKVLFLFKTYAQNLSYLLGRAAYQAIAGADASQRKQARGFLLRLFAVQTALAGVGSLPVTATAMGAGALIAKPLLKGALGNRGAMMAGAVLGGVMWAAFANGLMAGDDEPWDWQYELGEWLRQLSKGATGSEKMGELADKGLVRLLGVDVSQRIGMQDLWFKAPRDTDGNGKLDYSEAVLPYAGAVIGQAGNLYQGVQQMSEGNVGRGVETMLPKFIKDLVKTGRYAAEDNRTIKGELKNPVSATGLAGQAIGFAPAENAEKGRDFDRVKQVERFWDDKKRGMRDQYVNAVLENDIERKQEAMAKIREFNQTPGLPASEKINFVKLGQAVADRRKRIADSEKGKMDKRAEKAKAWDGV